MLLKKYLQAASNLFAENRLLKFCVVVLTVGFLWLSYQVKDYKEKSRTVVVPPHLNSKVVISGNWTSDSYVHEYIRYVGALLWNYSPGTAREQFSELLVSFHPTSFQSAKERLYILADQVEQTKASSVYYIHDIKNHPEKNYIEVTGNRQLSLQDKTVETTVKTYYVLYKIESGRFWILGIVGKNDQRNRPIGTSPGSALETPQNASDVRMEGDNNVE